MKTTNASAAAFSSTSAMLEYFGLDFPASDEKKKSTSQTEQAISIIRDRILDLSLPPGAHIDARVLSDTYGMGRTPAREALNRLTAEGLIVMQRNRGAFVRPMDISGVIEFFDAYLASERIVGFYCRTADEGLVQDLQRIEDTYQKAYEDGEFLEMTRLNSVFHGRLAIATRNEYIAEQALRLYNHSRRLAYFTAQSNRENFLDDLLNVQSKIKSDHIDIISIVAAGKNDELINVLTNHVHLFHTSVTRVLLRRHEGLTPLPA